MDDRKRLFITLALIALSVTAAIGLRWGVGQALTDSADLLRRAEEVALFLGRDDPYLDPDATYPPSALPVFAALLGPVLPNPRLPWLAGNAMALVALVAGLAVTLKIRSPVTLALLGLWITSTRPVRAGLALGQFHIMPVALAIWAALALDAKRPIAAGLLLGLALIKPTMVLPLLMLWMMVGAHRAWATALATQTALTLGASLWLGISPVSLIRRWLANAHGQLAAGSIDVPSLIQQAFPRENGGAALSLVLLILVAFGLNRIVRRPPGLATAWALATACLFVYHRHYDQVLLLPLVCWVAASSAAQRLGRALAIGLGLLLVVPTNPVWARWAEPIINAAVGILSYAVVLWSFTRTPRNLESALHHSRVKWPRATSARGTSVG